MLRGGLRTHPPAHGRPASKPCFPSRPTSALDRDAATDPFTGQPLRYVPDAEGFALYSVGDNGRDEGGKIAPMSGPNGLPQLRVTDEGHNNKDLGP